MLASLLILAPIGTYPLYQRVIIMVVFAYGLFGYMKNLNKRGWRI